MWTAVTSLIIYECRFANIPVYSAQASMLLQHIYVKATFVIETAGNTLRQKWLYNMAYHTGLTWWRHQMVTFSALLAICAGNSPVPVNFPHKGQWRGALMFALICVWINGWVNNREAGDLRRYRVHYDVIVMQNITGITDRKSYCNPQYINDVYYRKL